MKFIRITPQLAVNADKITAIDIAGREDPDYPQGTVMVRLWIAGEEESHIYRRAKTFREAEAIQSNLLCELEAS